jgi:hypothetical protein
LTIVLLVEGKTEAALKDVLKGFLDKRAAREGKAKVRLVTKPLDSRLLNQERVLDQVRMSLRDPETVCVVGLLDVYPRFQSAQDARGFLRQAVGAETRFHPHAAQFEVEAWLLPFWKDICQKLGVQRQPPGGKPEEVNLQNPPSHHLSRLFKLAKRNYDKPRDLKAILQGKDIETVAAQCPGFKAFLNTLLMCAGLTALP